MTFDIHIITCAKTYTRIPSLLKNLRPLYTNIGFNNLKIFVRGDVGDSNLEFDERLWEEHISSIYYILAKNIHIVHSGSSSDLSAHRNANLLKADERVIFPKRPLTNPEKSLINKHYNSLLQVSLPTVVLEDDSHMSSQNPSDILRFIQDFADTHFINLSSMKTLPYYGKVSKTPYGLPYLISPLGMTRTTAAYAVGPRVANSFISSFFPISLPADLHLQRLLCISRIPGVSLKDDLWINNSLEGLEQSSIQ